jgi:hypothetical protein
MNADAPLPTVTDDPLDVLACAYAERPRGAPSFFDLQGAVRRTVRQPDALLVEYEPSSAAAVEELAAAERLCCPTIGFDVAHTPAPTLRIRATPAQLDIFEQFLAS